MSRVTIGKHWPKSAPKGDHPAMCDYCGVVWRRSQLRVDGAGLYACPDEGDAKDVVTLAREQAAHAQKHMGPRPILNQGPQEGGEINPSTYTHATTADDIYAD